MLERQNALADRDTTRVTTQNAMNGIKGITDNMVFEKAWSIVKRNDGRNCRECGKRLEDDEFDAPFEWSYTCDDCGHRYKHGEDDPYE